jgi:hypothetical protein
MTWLRRWPPLLWIPIFIGSELILNGGNGKIDPAQVAVGAALIVLSFALTVKVLLERRPGRPQRGSFFAAIAAVVAFYVLCAIVAGALNGFGYTVAVLLAGIVPATAVALAVALAREKTVEDEDGRMRETTAADHEDPYPGVGMDDLTPLGDTPEVHDEITPHDLPLDNPARREAVRQAGGVNGTTRGSVEGAAGGPKRG